MDAGPVPARPARGGADGSGGSVGPGAARPAHPVAVSPEPRDTAEAARRLGFDEAALQAFFEAMPVLFLAHQTRLDPAYQPLLYGVAHDFRPEHLDRIDDAFALPHPRWSPGSQAEAIALLDGLRYPDAAPLRHLRGVPGLDLAHVGLYLHFFHHVYPPYTEASCRGLARLGVEVPFVRVRDPDVYGHYVRCVEALKERAPFWAFPESNVSLQRVVQAALDGWGGA